MVGPVGGTFVAVVRGIGVDAVDIPRFRATLARTPSLRRRVFTEVELAYAAGQADDTQSLAARFAAREATMKAMGLGLGAFGFHDVWVERLDGGRPALRVTGRAEELAAERGIRVWHLSLTHTDTVAIAYVIAHG